MTLIESSDNVVRARERFRAGIDSDIESLKGNDPRDMFSCNHSDDYVFNGVMLMRDFNLDYDELYDHICDGPNDLGVDSWWHDEYTNTLYLNQNKLYGKGSALTPQYVKDTLYHAYDALKRGDYDKSDALQRVFSKHIGDDDFQVCHRFNVTTAPPCNEAVKEIVHDFNDKFERDGRYAEVLGIDELCERYYGEPYVKRHRMMHVLKVANGKNAGGYVDYRTTHGVGKDKVDIRSIIVCPSVVELYKLCENAKGEDYNLYEDNVREHLGSRNSVNKEIEKTLRDPQKRRLFSLLNNGITITCMGDVTVSSRGLCIELSSPQVVNGCQTLSTIYHVLSEYEDDASREAEFKDVTVQVSIFGMNGDYPSKKDVIDNIVNCRNSQTAIQKNAFNLLHGPALRIQRDLEPYGIAIGVKMSDCNKIKSGYGPLALEDYRKRFIDSGLAARWDLLDEDKPNGLVIRDDKLLIPYETLCQIVCMTNLEELNPASKAGLLNPDAKRSKAVEGILTDMSKDTMANLVCAYLKIQSFKASYEGSYKHKGWFPNPAHALTGINRIECGGDLDMICDIVGKPGQAEMLMTVYARTCEEVFQQYRDSSGDGDDTYTKFVKSHEFDESGFRHIHDHHATTVKLEYENKALADKYTGAICPECGAEIGEGSRFCSACGAPVE